MPVTIVKDGFSMEHMAVGEGVSLAQILGNNSTETPLHCGSFRMEPGSSNTTDYVCSVFSLILEGEFTAEDLSKPGEVTTLKVHDIFGATKGDKVKWSSPIGGRAFYVIQLPAGTDPAPYFE